MLTAALVAKELDSTPRSAMTALHELVAVGILGEHVSWVPAGTGRPARLYVAQELLAIAG